MENGTLRQRQKPLQETKVEETTEETGHPGGAIKHGGATQIGRLLLINTYFISACVWYVSSLDNFS